MKNIIKIVLLFIKKFICPKYSNTKTNDTKENITCISDKMYYDEALENYAIEIRNIIFVSYKEQNSDYINKLYKLADNYHNNLNHIIEFMIPDLKEFYDELNENDIKEKLSKPTINYDNRTVNYLEHLFDDEHIFTFEFLDDNFEELQYFSIDG